MKKQIAFTKPFIIVALILVILTATYPRRFSDVVGLNISDFTKVIYVSPNRVSAATANDSQQIKAYVDYLNRGLFIRAFRLPRADGAGYTDLYFGDNQWVRLSGNVTITIY